jgi:branched-chain amino acid transport system substrate-binding protein
MKRFPISLILSLLLCIGQSRAIAADSTVPSDATRPSNAPSGRIELGMSTALTGPAANLGHNMRTGILVGLEHANAQGGVQSRMLHLLSIDDGYEPARTAPNMRQLLERDNVLAVIGNVGTPTAIAAIPIAEERKTLFFAAFSGAGVLRVNPPNRYVFNYRASYAEETGAMIDALIDRANLKVEDIAFFTQRDGYGDSGFEGGIAALKRHGLKDQNQVLHVRYERNTLAVENALATLLYAEREPRAIVMVGAYEPCAKFIQLAHQAGINPLFLNVSFVGSDSLASQLGDVPAHVIVTQVVPHPEDLSLPIVREYQADLSAIAPSEKPGYGSLEGYIAARTLDLALGRIHGPVTREAIVDALEGMGEFDLGLGEKLSFSPSDHQACHHVWPTILRDGQFVPFGWKDVAAELGDPPSPTETHYETPAEAMPDSPALHGGGPQ